MILTKDSILEAYKQGLVVIEPFDSSLVSINSVDVRLGPDLWHLERRDYRDLYIPEDSNWKKIEPVPAAEIRDRFPKWAEGIVPDDAPSFRLQSGEFYLATTLEKVGGRKQPGRRPVIPEMKAKSTIGRQGLTVALCAGLGDVGYAGRWALEVRVTDDGDVPIAVGTPIAQVVFIVGTSEGDTIYDGEDRYQHGDEIKFLPKPLKYVGVNNESKAGMDPAEKEV